MEEEILDDMRRDAVNHTAWLDRHYHNWRDRMESVLLDMVRRYLISEQREKELQADRDSEHRWANEYHGKWQAAQARVTVLEAERDAAHKNTLELADRVAAFAGQLAAWGHDAAAKEILVEILGNKVKAPDYYALRDDNQRQAQRITVLEAECARLREQCNHNAQVAATVTSVVVIHNDPERRR